jgi:hypothetical protein
MLEGTANSKPKSGNYPKTKVRGSQDCFLDSLFLIMKIDIENLKKKLDENLKKHVVDSRVLLSQFRMISDKSKKTGAYQDPTYLPFYYYLGKYIQPENIVEWGTRLGLLSSCFLKSCKTVKKIFTFQETINSFFSPRLGLKNIKDVYKGNLDFYYGGLLDVELEKKLSCNKWDMFIFNEEWSYDKNMQCLDMMWQYLNLDGVIVADYLTYSDNCGKAFKDFCQTKNRSPVYFQTRYGVGIMQK